MIEQYSDTRDSSKKSIIGTRSEFFTFSALNLDIQLRIRLVAECIFQDRLWPTWIAPDTGYLPFVSLFSYTH